MAPPLQKKPITFRGGRGGTVRKPCDSASAIQKWQTMRNVMCGWESFNWKIWGTSLFFFLFVRCHFLTHNRRLSQIIKIYKPGKIMGSEKLHTILGIVFWLCNCKLLRLNADGSRSTSSGERSMHQKCLKIRLRALYLGTLHAPHPRICERMCFAFASSI